MPVSMTDLLRDLTAESDDLVALLTPLDEPDWTRPTPAEGWSIHDQVGHLAFFDGAATTALLEPEQFRREADDLTAGGDDFPDRMAEQVRAFTTAELLEWFREARRLLVTSFDGVDPGARLPWFGPDMSAASSVTARLMETWAHGQDIADALGVTRTPAARLRHVAHLGVATRGFAYALRGRDVPDVPLRVELAAPDGTSWTWGPADALDGVTGSALDFCLVVTQRRHVDDTDLAVTGAAAVDWLSIAQAFAGAPAAGRPRSATSTRGDT